MGIVFLDTETTGLADNCNIWDIGLIQRQPTTTATLTTWSTGG